MLLSDILDTGLRRYDDIYTFYETIKLAAVSAATFSYFCFFLIIISRRSASALDIQLLLAISSTGSLALVYREAVPLLWVIKRFSILFVMPVYNVLSRQRKIYTIQFLFVGAFITVFSL